MGEHNTLRYIRNDPVKSKLLEDAKRMLAERASHSAIARETGLCRETVIAINEAYADEIHTTFRQHASFRAAKIVNMSLDALEAQLEAHLDPDNEFTIPPGTVSLIGCQWVDKKQLLDTDPNQAPPDSNDATKRTISIEDLWKELKAQKAKGEAIDATAIPITTTQPPDND